MTLPVISTPTYNLTLPSSGKEIKYRPFLVREEKILLMAKESKDDNDMFNAIRDVMKSCIIGDIDIDNLPIFDIEWIFINLRSKSIGETVEFSLKCKGNNGENNKICGNIIPLTVNLDTVKVKKDPNHKNTIMLTETIGIKMKYPVFATANKYSSLSKANMFDFVKDSIDMIFDGENTFDISTTSDEDLETFINSLSSKQFAKIEKFYETMPKVTKDVKFECSKCGNKGKYTLTGVYDFFG